MFNDIFEEIKTVVLDMDDTMYPKSLGIGHQFLARVEDYAVNDLGYNEQQLENLLSLWKKDEEDVIAYLRKEYKDEQVVEDFMEYVCALDVSSIKHNDRLKKQFEVFPYEIIIYTNTTHSHIDDVLSTQLRVKDILKKFHTTKETGYVFKHNPKAFRLFLDYHKLDATKTVMVEDNLKYLKSAKENGMKTIFVLEGVDVPYQDKEKYPYVDCIAGNINQVLDLLAKV